MKKLTLLFGFLVISTKEDGVEIGETKIGSSWIMSLKYSAITKLT